MNNNQIRDNTMNPTQEFVQPINKVRFKDPIAVNVAELATFTPQYRHRSPSYDSLTGAQFTLDFIIDDQTGNTVIGFDGRTEDGKFTKMLSHCSPKEFIFYLTLIPDGVARSISMALEKAGVKLPMLTEHEKKEFLDQELQQKVIKQANKIGQPEHVGTFKNAKAVLLGQTKYTTCCGVDRNVLAAIVPDSGVIVAIYNPASKKAALACLDFTTQTSNALNQMFYKMQTDGSTLEVHLRGGNIKTRNIGVSVLNNVVNRDDVIIQSCNLIEISPYDNSLAIDPCTGKIYTQFSHKQLDLNNDEIDSHMLSIQIDTYRRLVEGQN